jgi:hypothetical protein
MATESSPAAPPERRPPARRRRSVWRRIGLVFAGLAVVLGAARIALPSFVHDYVTRTLDQNPLYAGRVGDVTIHLWRGAYSIEDVRISKRTGDIPVPFFSARRIDFSLEWPALRRGHLRGKVRMDGPEINFVDAAEKSNAQNGEGGPWLKMLRDLHPFRIDATEIHDGRVRFRAFHTEPPVDVHLSELEGTIDNLTNVHRDLAPLYATVKASGLAMDHARVQLEMRLDAQAYAPTFQVAVRLIGLDVTKINDLALAYGRFDFEHGWFDLVVELDAKNGQVAGYVKPLFRDLEVFSLRRDVRGGDVLGAFWQALVGLVKGGLKNPQRDQVATLVPLSGDLSGPSPDVLATLGNLLHNAFVRAYLPNLEGTLAEKSGITFGPASPPESADAVPRPPGDRP